MRKKKNMKKLLASLGIASLISAGGLTSQGELPVVDELLQPKKAQVALTKLNRLQEAAEVELKTVQVALLRK